VLSDGDDVHARRGSSLGNSAIGRDLAMVVIVCVYADDVDLRWRIDPVVKDVRVVGSHAGDFHRVRICPKLKVIRSGSAWRPHEGSRSHVTALVKLAKIIRLGKLDSLTTSTTQHSQISVPVKTEARPPMLASRDHHHIRKI
jgi:hypothetical protein